MIKQNIFTLVLCLALGSALSAGSLSFAYPGDVQNKVLNRSADCNTAKKVLKKFLDLETRGGALNAAPEYVEFFDQAPMSKAWTTATVVEGYNIEKCSSLSTDEITIPVKFDAVGTEGAESCDLLQFDGDVHSKKVDYTLVRNIDDVWKIKASEDRGIYVRPKPLRDYWKTKTGEDQNSVVQTAAACKIKKLNGFMKKNPIKND